MENNTENQPVLENYQYYGHCRSYRHINANRTQGGVGIFVHCSFVKKYFVSILDKSFDGILCMLFKDKVTDYCFTVYSCYLPPEHSPHGRDSNAFFTHLLSLVYINSYVDVSFVCGDLNSRLGDQQEIIHAIDDIPARNVIDIIANRHGDAFYDFLIESRMIVANGRVPGNHDFTSISTRGKSVVDFCVIPQENFENCISFDIHAMSDLIDDLDMQCLISEKCKMSDHSILILNYQLNPLSSSQNDIHTEVTPNNLSKKYKYHTMSPEFLRSDTWITILDNLISKIEQVHPMQNEVDTFYEDMTSEIFNEMDRYIDVKVLRKSTRKRYKNHKPFWNDELTLAWKEMSNAEKTFRKIINNRALSKVKRHEFLTKRKLFDKLLRSTERNYNRKKAFEIEEINTSNPTEFWKQISRLGPKKSTNIPLKVYDDQGNIVDDKDQVLDSWKNEFSNLYNLPEGQSSIFDDEFYNDLSVKLQDIKQYELHNNAVDMESYNLEFSNDELERVCRNLKLGKAVGPDMIPNEILKHDGIKGLLLPFINKCFISNIIPSCWRKAIIVPIPKSASKDPFVPLNYRGISLLSCLYKVFTSLINTRITAHCEINQLLVDEQNGFRSGRSCQDHIYTLTSIIRNRKVNGLDTFCAFVDFQKAFDWVNRDLLLYKLSQSFGIHGRLFSVLSTIYSSSNAQIRVNGLLTESFGVASGVRQGDILSPILFSMYLNDLASGIKDLNIGIDINGTNVSILLYADDIVLIAENETSLQMMLDFISKWCSKWRMAINAGKTQIVHFRHSNKQQSAHSFQFGSHILETVGFYKYLGVTLDEHLEFELNSSILADAAGRALGAIRSKLKNVKECGFGPFNTLFNCGVLSICDYSAGI